jgi:hypothetical protein
MMHGWIAEEATVCSCMYPSQFSELYATGILVYPYLHSSLDRRPPWVSATEMSREVVASTLGTGRSYHQEVQEFSKNVMVHKYYIKILLILMNCSSDGSLLCIFCHKQGRGITQFICRSHHSVPKISH